MSSGQAAGDTFTQRSDGRVPQFFAVEAARLGHAASHGPAYGAEAERVARRYAG